MSAYNTLYIYISNIKITLASVIYTIKLSLYQIFIFFLSVATLDCCLLSLINSNAGVSVSVLLGIFCYTFGAWFLFMF